MTLSGDTALVGAYQKTVGGQASAGAAYVFTRWSKTWSQQAELSDPAAAIDDNFGDSVALSAGTALVGANGTTLVGQAAPVLPTPSPSGRRRPSAPSPRPRAWWAAA